MEPDETEEEGFALAEAIGMQKVRDEREAERLNSGKRRTGIFDSKNEKDKTESSAERDGNVSGKQKGPELENPSAEQEKAVASTNGEILQKIPKTTFE